MNIGSHKIRIRTQEDWDRIVGLCLDDGYIWADGNRDSHPEYWNDFGEETYLMLVNGHMWFGGIHDIPRESFISEKEFYEKIGVKPYNTDRHKIRRIVIKK